MPKVTRSGGGGGGDKPTAQPIARPTKPKQAATKPAQVAQVAAQRMAMAPKPTLSGLGKQEKQQALEKQQAQEVAEKAIAREQRIAKKSQGEKEQADRRLETAAIRKNKQAGAKAQADAAKKIEKSASADLREVGVQAQIVDKQVTYHINTAIQRTIRQMAPVFAGTGEMLKDSAKHLGWYEMHYSLVWEVLFLLYTCMDMIKKSVEHIITMFDKPFAEQRKIMEQRKLGTNAVVQTAREESAKVLQCLRDLKTTIYVRPKTPGSSTGKYRMFAPTSAPPALIHAPNRILASNQQQAKLDLERLILTANKYKAWYETENATSSTQQGDYVGKKWKGGDGGKENVEAQADFQTPKRFQNIYGRGTGRPPAAASWRRPSPSAI